MIKNTTGVRKESAELVRLSFSIEGEENISPELCDFYLDFANQCVEGAKKLLSPYAERLFEQESGENERKFVFKRFTYALSLRCLAEKENLSQTDVELKLTRAGRILFQRDCSFCFRMPEMLLVPSKSTKHKKGRKMKIHQNKDILGQKVR